MTDIEFTAYDSYPLTPTVGVYRYSDEKEDWYRVGTLESGDS